MHKYDVDNNDQFITEKETEKKSFNSVDYRIIATNMPTPMSNWQFLAEIFQ